MKLIKSVLSVLPNIQGIQNNDFAFDEAIICTFARRKRAIQMMFCWFENYLHRISVRCLKQWLTRHIHCSSWIQSCCIDHLSSHLPTPTGVSANLCPDVQPLAATNVGEEKRWVGECDNAWYPVRPYLRLTEKNAQCKTETRITNWFSATSCWRTPFARRTVWLQSEVSFLAAFDLTLGL